MKDPEHACLFRRRKKLRPGEIIRTAQAIFSKKGFAATRLEDVAAMEMTNIFEKGIASGNFRRFKPDVVADIFLSPISLCALDDVWKRDSSNEEILKVAFDILIRGLAEGFK